MEKSYFPQNLKLADITPIYKKNFPLDKTNYRHSSLLPVVSKNFEKIMQKQINDFIISFLFPYLCGYRKDFNTQQALLTLVENWRKNLDNNGFCGVMVINFSKAFDTLKPRPLNCKNPCIWFLTWRFKTSSQLTFLKDGTEPKLTCLLVHGRNLLKVYPKDLGPILFHLYLNHLFNLSDFTEVCNFADDTTFHACDNDLNDLIKRLEHDASTKTNDTF